MKLALATGLLLGVLAAPGAARATVCDRVEPVFGVKAGGLLIEHSYCVEGFSGRYLPPRVIASFENQSVSKLFWGGRLPGNLSVVYAVTADGRLKWGRQVGNEGVLGSMIEVGHQFGDWRRYPTLFSAGEGKLFAIDERGRLRRWQHIGWLDGGDFWEPGPSDLGPGCKPGAMVFAAIKGPSSSVLQRDIPPSYAFCGWDGRVRTVSLLPEGLVSPSVAPAPGVVFALRAADGRLTRLTLEVGTLPIPLWRIDSLADASYQRVFTGNSFKPGSDDNIFKYEWQWTFYDGKYEFH